jgi:hypothetical protein
MMRLMRAKMSDNIWVSATGDQIFINQLRHRILREAKEMRESFWA